MNTDRKTVKTERESKKMERHIVKTDRRSVDTQAYNEGRFTDRQKRQRDPACIRN